MFVANAHHWYFLTTMIPDIGNRPIKSFWLFWLKLDCHGGLIGEYSAVLTWLLGLPFLCGSRSTDELYPDVSNLKRICFCRAPRTGFRSTLFLQLDEAFVAIIWTQKEILSPSIEYYTMRES